MNPSTPAATGHCLVVMYHYVRKSAETPFPDIKALDPADFAAQLDWLMANYRVLDYTSFLEALFSGGLRQPAALLTFDDGFSDHYHQAWPLMRRRGLSGLFFLSGLALGPRPRLLNVHKTHFLLARLGSEDLIGVVQTYLQKKGVAWPDIQPQEGLYRYDQNASARLKRLLNYQLDLELTSLMLDELFEQHLGHADEFARQLYLSTEQIKEMAAAGQTFGGHTQSHLVLARLDEAAQRAELAAGAAAIRELTGQASVPFSFPFGHPTTYNQHTLALLRDCGYAVAFNTARSLLRWDVQSPFELPRLDTKDIPPFAPAPSAADSEAGRHA